MRHYFKVIGYDESLKCHICEQNGYQENIDLLKGGSLPPNISPYSLIEKTISVSYTRPFISIGEGIKIED